MSPGLDLSPPSRPRSTAWPRAGALGRAEAVALLDTPAARRCRPPRRRPPPCATGPGRPITFSRKVFIPLTTLCRDYCGYCTFRRDPGEPGALTMAPDEVLAVAEAGERLGGKEALFSLGDKPEALFPEHREFLRRHGHRTTLGYLRAAPARWSRRPALLPHANPGLMTERDLPALREVNVSMGSCWRASSERLLGPGRPARSRARQGAGAPAQDHRAARASSASPSPPAS